MKVFIIGIAGGTGSRVAKLLVEQGDVVSGLYRHSEQGKVLQAMRATGVFGDIATVSAQELSSMIHAHDAVVFSAGAGEQDDENMIDTIDTDGVLKTAAAARSAGVPRLLLVSVFPEAWRERNLGQSFDHYILAKKKAESGLVQTDLDWVILRPSALKDDPGCGTVSLGMAEIHEEITRDDVAATIVGLLHTPHVKKRILEVTAGTVPIPEAVEAFSREPHTRQLSEG